MLVYQVVDDRFVVFSFFYKNFFFELWIIKLGFDSTSSLISEFKTSML